MSSNSRIRRTSHIWGYFKELSENKVKCNFCSKSLSYKGGSLFNLTRHLRTQHPTVCLTSQRLTPPSEDTPGDPDAVTPILVSGEYSAQRDQNEQSSSQVLPSSSSAAAAATSAVLPQPQPPRHIQNQSAISQYFNRPLTNKKMPGNGLLGRGDNS